MTEGEGIRRRAYMHGPGHRQQCGDSQGRGGVEVGKGREMGTCVTVSTTTKVSFQCKAPAAVTSEESAFQCRLFVISLIGETASSKVFTPRPPSSPTSELRYWPCQRYSVSPWQHKDLQEVPTCTKSFNLCLVSSPQHMLLWESNNRCKHRRHMASSSFLTCRLQIEPPSTML